MERVESVLPGPPCLVGIRFPVPLQAVVGKGICEEERGCGKCHEPVVCDWKAGPLGLFLCFLHRHGVMGNSVVAGRVAKDFAN